MRSFSVKLAIVIGILIVATVYLFRAGLNANLQESSRNIFQFLGEGLSKSFGNR
jgi:hypothetical protein